MIPTLENREGGLRWGSDQAHLCSMYVKENVLHNKWAVFLEDQTTLSGKTAEETQKLYKRGNANVLRTYEKT